ncbi:MAG: hypothetical protein COA78_27110 [Blastopirellula sp.]|nr:MAG: hypothetical protein COA78_27110 [Blastopirellula sp.]
MTAAPDEYPALYLKGIELFNDCEFLDASNTWVELWTDCHGPSRRYYQGLIQTAVCLHHFVNENTSGAVKVYHTSLDFLAPYRPKHLGIDLDQFLGELGGCLQEILESNERFPTESINPDLIPDLILLD